jgi:hypothetical protein
MELDRLFATIDQKEHVLVTQGSGSPIEQKGVARYSVGAYMRNATSKAAGAKIGQHDPFKAAQGAIRRGVMTDTFDSTPREKEGAIKALGKLNRGDQPLADPGVANALGRKPTGFI